MQEPSILQDLDRYVDKFGDPRLLMIPRLQYSAAQHVARLRIGQFDGVRLQRTNIK